MISIPKISIVVPTYNESENIELFLKRLGSSLKKTKHTFEVIFIDDHSTDGTYEYLQNFSKKTASVSVMTKQGKKGKSFSLLEGFAKAKGDIIVMIDSDLQYPPEAIPHMILLLDTADIVVANRVRYSGPRIRQIQSFVFKNIIGRLLYGLRHDVQSGLKVFKRDVTQILTFTPHSGWAFDLEFLHRARQAGFQIVNHDIDFSHREKSSSKVSPLKAAWEVGIHALLLKTKHIPPVHFSPGSHGSMQGAGVGYNKKRYVTHSTLPHHMSALYVVTFLQKLLVAVLIVGCIAGLISNALLTIQVFVAILSVIYFIDVLFNLYLVLLYLHVPQEITFTQDEIGGVVDSKLPIYTILCPLYKEGRIIPQFLKAIEKLEWPKNKLDVQLLLEEDDNESQEIVKKMKLPSYVRAIVVPHSMPKTKPKACNYGLLQATGEYLVIFDAEDIPEPLQLKKAYLAFQKVPKDVKCLQAKLNYFNPHQNLLTRFFTAEYSLWFDVTLPGLQAINTSIPLGGTSNHFRTKNLLSLKGWDPFNVTEDADLGIRLFKQGYKTAIIDSITLEEANSRWGNWLRQRSRWLKGYMQTYLVHMRDYFTFTKNQGIHSLIFQLTVGGKIAFIIINPLLWVATISYFALYQYVGPTIESFYPPVVFYMAAFSLVFGNFLFLYYYMIGCARKNQWSLVKYVFLVPFYWLMTSIAASIALYQLIFKPHYWEKTTHGLNLPKEIKKSIPEMVVVEEEQEVGFHFPNKFRTQLELLIKSRHKYASGAFLILASVGANFLNYVFNAYLGRTVSLSDFALISLISSLLYIISLPYSALGLTVSYRSGFLEGKHGQGGSYLFWEFIRKRFLLLSFIVLALFLIGSPFFESFFNVSSFVPFVIFSPVIVIGLLSAIDRGYLSGKLMFTALALSLLVESAVKLVSAYAFVTLHVPIYAYAAISISVIIAYFASWIPALRTRQNKKEVKLIEVKHFPKKYFLTAFISGLSTIAFLTLDIILVKHFLSPNDAGRYALISLVGKMIFFFGTLTIQFVGPIVSRNEGANRKSDKEFNIVILATIVLTGIGFVALGIVPQLTVPLLLGAKAQQILQYLPLFAAAMSCFTLSRIFVTYYQNKRIYTFSVLTFVISILQVVLFFFYHQDLQSVVNIMAVIGVLNLLVAVILHFLVEVVKPIENNILDLFELFSTKVDHNLANKKTLNILIFNWRDTKHVWAGGAEVYIHEIAKRWVTAGHSVTVFCGHDGKTSRREVVDGVSIVRRGGFYTVYIWAFIYYVLKFRGIFDVVIDSENGIPFFTPLYVRKPIFTIIYHVHQEVFRKHLMFPFSSFAMFLEADVMPFIYRHIKIITISESTKEEIVKHGLKHENDIEIVNPGIEHGKYATSKKTSYPSMVYVGRHKPYKNIDIAIKTFSKILPTFPEARFFIAGEGENTDSLKDLVKKLSLHNKVIFYGKVSEKEKIKLLSQSWVAIQPSQIEGWGITVIEANACGTPVVASNVSGLRDSIQNEVTGYLIPYKNLDQFTEKVKKIIRNTQLRKTLSKNAIDWSRNFDWDTSANKTLHLFYDINFNNEYRGKRVLAKSVIYAEKLGK